MNSILSALCLAEADLARRLVQAYRVARAEALPLSPSQGHLHAQRSAAFVEAFAAQLEQHYSGAPKVCVFRKTRPSPRFKRGAVGRSEFLFDVLACVMEECAPAVRSDVARLDFIRAPLFQMESELALDTAEATEDFSWVEVPVEGGLA